MTTRTYRVQVTGQFAGLMPAVSEQLRDEQGAHDLFLAAFTPEGTFTYAPTLTRFTLRYLLEVSEDSAAEADEVAMAATPRGVAVIDAAAAAPAAAAPAVAAPAKQRACGVCGKLGHYAKTFPSRPRPAPAAAGAPSVPAVAAVATTTTMTTSADAHGVAPV